MFHDLVLPCYIKVADSDFGACITAQNDAELFGWVNGLLQCWDKNTGYNTNFGILNLEKPKPKPTLHELAMQGYADRLTIGERGVLRHVVNKKIAAIKWLRERLDIGLLEAKQFVEWFAASHYVTNYEY